MSAPFPLFSGDNLPAALNQEQIYRSFQASPEEIRAVIGKEKAVLINQCYQKFDSEYLMRFFEILQANCILQDKGLADCSMKELESLMEDHQDDYPTDITRAILQTYSHNDRILCKEAVRLFGFELLKAKPVWLQMDLEGALNKVIGDLRPSMSDLNVQYMPVITKNIGALFIGTFCRDERVQSCLLPAQLASG